MVETRMLRLMCDVTRFDRIGNEFNKRCLKVKKHSRENERIYWDFKRVERGNNGKIIKIIEVK